MCTLKGVVIAVLVFSVFLSGCTRKPSVKFCAKWSDDMTEMWNSGSTTLNYSDLESKKYLIYGGFGATSSGKVFVLLIKGKLPLGKINIKAVYIADRKRVPAFILPAAIQNNDPHANLRAVQIYELKGVEDPFKLGVRTYLGTYEVDPGLYYIFLEKDDMELAGSELLIR